MKPASGKMFCGALLAALVLGCAAVTVDPSDTGIVPTRDSGSCAIDLQVVCSTPNRVCCHGSWLTFSDGPCWSRDMGAPDGAAPDAGLSCATEGARTCLGAFVAECHSGRLETLDIACGFIGCS